MANPNPVPLPPGTGRKAGSRNKRSYVIEALQRYHEGVAKSKGDGGPVDGQECYWMAEVELAAGGDAQARSTIAKKLEPDLKQMDLTADVDVGRKHYSNSELRERVVTALVGGPEGSAGIGALIASLDASCRPADGSDTESS